MPRVVPSVTDADWLTEVLLQSNDVPASEHFAVPRVVAMRHSKLINSMLDGEPIGKEAIFPMKRVSKHELELALSYMEQATSLLDLKKPLKQPLRQLIDRWRCNFLFSAINIQASPSRDKGWLDSMLKLYKAANYMQIVELVSLCAAATAECVREIVEGRCHLLLNDIFNALPSELHAMWIPFYSQWADECIALMYMRPDVLLEPMAACHDLWGLDDDGRMCTLSKHNWDLGNDLHRKLVRCRLEFDPKTAIRIGTWCTDIDLHTAKHDLALIEDMRVECNTRMSEQGFRMIATTLSHLRVLSCAGSKFVTDDALAVLVQELQELVCLDLSRCAITDVGLDHLASRRSLALQVLNLSECHYITDHGVRLLVTLAQLECLDLTRCSGITDAAFQITDDSVETFQKSGGSIGGEAFNRLPSGSCSASLDAGEITCTPSLRWLNLEGCGTISDLGVSFLADSARRLEHLGLSGLQGITNDALGHVARLKSLHSLDLSRCRVSREGFPYLIRMPKLRHLNIAECPSISNHDVCTLRGDLPMCYIEWFMRMTM